MNRISSPFATRWASKAATRSLPAVPGAEQIGTTEEGDGLEAVERVRASNHQHPDYDTAEWPPCN